ncbi:MAG TPA: hypothetical protein VIJ34_12950 [Acidimicrobiales bacterium]
MTNTTKSDSTGPEEESEIRGDNPGVGGLPAHDVEISSDEEDPEDEERRGDNPGVGGLPDKDGESGSAKRD